MVCTTIGSHWVSLGVSYFPWFTLSMRVCCLFSAVFIHCTWGVIFSSLPTIRHMPLEMLSTHFCPLGNALY